MNAIVHNGLFFLVTNAGINLDLNTAGEIKVDTMYCVASLSSVVLRS